jgi:hypothetical protein
MKRILLSLAAVALAVLTVASPAGVADGGSLWPFSSTSSTPAAQPAPAKSSPSMLKKISNGTKSLLKKTKNALLPKAAAKPISIQPPNPYMPKASAAQKKSWFDGLLAKKPPPKPKSPSEWIGLPRPN